MSNASIPKVSFRRQQKKVTVSPTPEALFGDLPKNPQRVPALWGHQTDQLRAYFDSYVEKSNVAIELPTGSGKTLVGLLISEWRRRSKGERVVYACPTTQLAEQTAISATKQGIEVALLTGSAREWDSSDLASYQRSNRIAVTTYSAIFNSNSRLDDADLLVFDDAHTAEQYVSPNWTIAIDSSEDLYQLIVDEVSPSLEPAWIAHITNVTREKEREVRLIAPSAIATHEVPLQELLSNHLTDNRRFAIGQIRGHLRACHFYISDEAISIRPYIPPTFTHKPFANAKQRIYLSATLGISGEIQRSFGVPKVDSIVGPVEWNRTGGGRRFFVFPEIAHLDGSPIDRDELLRAIVSASPKATLIAQSDARTKALADRLEINTESRFGMHSPVERAYAAFLESEVGALLAPNRYDGMDLRGDICNLLVIDGVPAAMSYQDSFLLSKVHAGQVLSGRLTTRLTQGFGRCTRGPQDHSVVVITSPELSSFLSRSENLALLPVEMQAEIRFGLDMGEQQGPSLPALVRSSLNQDDAWQDAEAEILSERQGLVERVPDYSADLSKAVSNEILAARHAWNGDFKGAATAAAEVSQALKTPSLSSYRAFWLFLQSEYLAISNLSRDPGVELKRLELVREAMRFTPHSSWLREMTTTVEAGYSPTGRDTESARNIIGLLHGEFSNEHKRSRRLSECKELLAQHDKASLYENGLLLLGKFVGASEAFKPKFEGRTDAVWEWSDLWMTLEAKSEQKSGGVISMEYVRQANTQLASLRADLEADEIPAGSFTTIISPRLATASSATAIAHDHLFHTTPVTIELIARDTERAWKEILNLSLDDSALEYKVSESLWTYQILPDQLTERLTTERV